MPSFQKQADVVKMMICPDMMDLSGIFTIFA